MLTFYGVNDYVGHGFVKTTKTNQQTRTMLQSLDFDHKYLIFMSQRWHSAHFHPTVNVSDAENTFIDKNGTFFFFNKYGYSYTWGSLCVLNWRFTTVLLWKKTKEKPRINESHR